MGREGGGRCKGGEGRWGERVRGGAKVVRGGAKVVRGGGERGMREKRGDERARQILSTRVFPCHPYHGLAVPLLLVLYGLLRLVDGLQSIQ